MNTPASPSRSRLSSIESAKALLILLVVFGHITLRSMPTDNTWYEVSRYLVYQFHMPAFMALSGFVFAYAMAGRAPLVWLRRNALRKTDRLLVPFAALGLLIVCGKMAMAHIMPVDAVPESFGRAVIGIFGLGGSSPVNSIWYVFVLLQYTLLTPVLLHVSKGKLWPWVALASALFFVGAPTTFFADKFAAHFVFFLIGAWLAQAPDRTLPMLKEQTLGLWLVFGGILSIIASLPHSTHTMFFAGLVGSFAIFALCQQPWISHNRYLLALAPFSFAIYLFNTIAIGVTKGLILKFSGWDGAMFLLWAPVLFVAGLLGPILFKALILRRVGVLERYTS